VARKLFLLGFVILAFSVLTSPASANCREWVTELNYLAELNRTKPSDPAAFTMSTINMQLEKIINGRIDELAIKIKTRCHDHPAYESMGVWIDKRVKEAAARQPDPSTSELLSRWNELVLGTK
jgi:hypothetical protein